MLYVSGLINFLDGTQFQIKNIEWDYYRLLLQLDENETGIIQKINENSKNIVNIELHHERSKIRCTEFTLLNAEHSFSSIQLILKCKHVEFIV